MLGAVQPAVASRVMGYYSTHPLGSEVVGHGDRYVHPVNYVFTCGIVKVPVTHIEPPVVRIFIISIAKEKHKKKEQACHFLSWIGVLLLSPEAIHPVGSRHLLDAIVRLCQHNNRSQELTNGDNDRSDVCFIEFNYQIGHRGKGAEQ